MQSSSALHAATKSPSLSSQKGHAAGALVMAPALARIGAPVIEPHTSQEESSTIVASGPVVAMLLVDSSSVVSVRMHPPAIPNDPRSTAIIATESALVESFMDRWLFNGHTTRLKSASPRLSWVSVGFAIRAERARGDASL